MFTASFTSPANDVQTALLRHVHVIVRLFMFSKHCLLNVANSGTHRFTWRVTLRIITDVCGITVHKCDDKPSEFCVLIWTHTCPINFPLVESCKWQGVHISVVTTERTLWPLYLSSHPHSHIQQLRLASMLSIFFSTLSLLSGIKTIQYFSQAQQHTYVIPTHKLSRTFTFPALYFHFSPSSLSSDILCQM